MRKLSVLVVLVGIFASCSQETNIYLDGKKMDVLLNPKTAPKTVSKGVDRGDIYVWVKDINVEVTELATGVTLNEVFTLTDNAGDVSEFIIEDVPVGTNVFNATTTTNGASINSHYIDVKNADLSIYVAMNPYAVYESTDVSSFISEDSLNAVTLDMTTQNGRLISNFQLSKNGYAITVVTTTDGVLTSTSTISNNESVTAYLSNNNALGGVLRQHTVTIHRPNNSEVLNTYVINETVIESTSISNYYEVGINEVMVKSSSLTFTWQVWNEQGN
tara:strand:- start:57 stop:878 length:822 start_codon:yes stop_codon:yes gene_type:complete